MILRRVVSHLHNQQWTAIGLELVILIVGVFMGIELGNWNEDRKSAADERIYVERLREDIEVIGKQVRDRVDFEVEMAQWLNISLDLMEQPPSEERRQNLGVSLTKLVSRGTLLIESPTFFELQSSGNLSLIRDRALRERLIDFFAKADRFEQIVATNNSNYVDAGYVNFLRDDLGVGLVFIEDVAEDMMARDLATPDLARSIEKLFDERITAAPYDMLMLPPDDEVWDRLARQLTWRAAVIGSNYAIAHKMVDEANDALATIDAVIMTFGASSPAISAEPLAIESDANP